MNTNTVCQSEYDFALIITGVKELTTEIEDALFEAGCDDATLSIQYGELYMEFSRNSSSLMEAILSAIKNVHCANIGAEVMRVDECNLVTQAEIARRIGRSRQLVQQYIVGKRGPGGFPAPVCNLTEGVPMWAWCAVSLWLCENNIIKQEALEDAETVYTINHVLETLRQKRSNPTMVHRVEDAFLAGCSVCE